MSQHDHDFDSSARAMHGTALRQLSPATLARLRSARAQAHSATPPRRWAWLAATALSGVLAVGLGMQFLPVGSPTPSDTAQLAQQSTPPHAADATGSVTLLDENPDLYLWLASSEAQPLAME